MEPLTVGVIREQAAGECRVALTPDGVRRLHGWNVLVERDAGTAAWFDNSTYVDAGAEVLEADEVYARADVIVCVGRPEPARLHAGQTVVGMLAPLLEPAFAVRLADLGVTAVSLDGIPRTLARAQAMDALSSQANVAGYKAVLVAANAFERFFPLLMTAAGTVKPAEVLVMGAGVAGLQAIATARRLGAVVRAYDVRPAAQSEVESLGATFIELRAVSDATGEGGYARALTADEQEALQTELAEQVARHDVVITTAQVPGRRPPLLVTDVAVKAMRPGSVIVDLAAGPLGGNVALVEPDRTIVTDNGVTLVGAGNLPAAMPTAASTAYSRNIVALLSHLFVDGVLTIGPDDDIAEGVLVTRDRVVVHQATARLLEGTSA